VHQEKARRTSLQFDVLVRDVEAFPARVGAYLARAESEEASGFWRQLWAGIKQSVPPPSYSIRMQADIAGRQYLRCVLEGAFAGEKDRRVAAEARTQALQAVIEEIVSVFRGMFDRIARIQCSFGPPAPRAPLPGVSSRPPQPASS
jgi:hypothetical protein